MRLDATDLRYITNDEFRVLTAVEVGSKSHEIVPTSQIAELSGVRGGNVAKALGELSKRKLVSRVQGAKYEGYRLTYGGLDYLALKTFSRRKPASVAAVGKRIGVGKESDIHVVVDEAGDQRVLKMHRLGRISFRQVKSKRDYLGHRSSASWMHLSRLAAQREFTYMKVLHANGFPVPVPIDQARHCLVMSLIDSYPLRQVAAVDSPNELYAKLMELIVRFAHHGLIHGDFNEFNILIKRDGEPVVIDFPQMVSTRHANAEYFFNRDVNCIRRFFRRRFRYEGQSWPTWKDVIDDEEGGESTTGQRKRLDLEVEASGFGRAMNRELEDHMIEMLEVPENEDDDLSDEDEGDSGEEGQGEDEDAPEEEQGPAVSEKFDEEAFQQQMAARLEAMRLNKALGNDDPADLELGGNEPVSEDESDEETSDEESDDGSSDIAPTSEYPTRRPRPTAPRVDVKRLEKDGKGELENVLKAQAGKQKRREEGKHHSRKAPAKAGQMKGHKWKKSANFLVEKNSGW